LSRRRFGVEGFTQLRAMITGDAASEPAIGVQREFEFLLLDEADNILIDEARTPLIVSAAANGAAQQEANLYRWAAAIVDRFQESTEYRLEEPSQYPVLTGRGRRVARETPLPATLANTPLPDLYENIQRAIHVRQQYVRDRHYVVREGKIVIVDEYTGRLAEGRQWRAGLHQAIEAREGLEITVATGEAARITVQDLCLQYRRLCGMTGTVASSASELRKIYNLQSVGIPTHRPTRRTIWPTIVCGTESDKWSAIVSEVQSVRVAGRPVLIGTRSIDKSERLSELLSQAGIPHVVLNARKHAQEAEIVSRAGTARQVTVATNMAGRGTDIRLDDECIRLGGLHVICTELHDASRIDQQLTGRCARQGDPGTVRQFLSLDDDILQSGLSRGTIARLEQFRRFSADRLTPLIRHFRSAQRRIERRHFQARRLLLYRERQRQNLQREMGQDHYLDTPGH
jgi:preprotein translocase subunit SecA